MRSLFGPAATATDWIVAPLEAAVGFLYSWLATRLLGRRQMPGPSGGVSVRTLLFSAAATDLRKAA